MKLLALCSWEVGGFVKVGNIGALISILRFFLYNGTSISGTMREYDERAFFDQGLL